MRKSLTGAVLVTTLLASVAAAAPGPGKPVELALRGPVRAMAADGDRVALSVGFGGGCVNVLVWEPTRKRVVRLQPASACEPNPREGTNAVALAGTRAAWLRTAGGNSLEMWLRSATLTRTTPVDIAMTATTGDAGHGELIRRPIGDGALIAFTVEHRCDAYTNEGPSQCPLGVEHGTVLDAAVYAIGGLGLCPTRARRDPPGCSRIARSEGELTVLAVHGRRMAVRADRGVLLLGRTGGVLRTFDVAARTAALTDTRVALRTADAVEVYDLASGDLVQRFAAARDVRLEDLERDVLVTASAGTLTLRRLGGGRTVTFHTGGVARGQLEPAGLFVSGARRVTFLPMREVARRLGT
jgi:hypothetical protein